MFPVKYRGYWSYGNSLILGVSSEGLMLIKPDDKFVINEYRYQALESILLDPSDSFITITLQRHLTENNHKCFVFETTEKMKLDLLLRVIVLVLQDGLRMLKHLQRSSKVSNNSNYNFQCYRTSKLISVKFYGGF